MRIAFFALPMLGLSVVAKEVSLKARQVQTILDTLQKIQGITADLDVAINAYNGGDPKPILDGSHTLIQATTSGADTINSLATISLNDAVKVQNFVKTLQAQVEKTINDLVTKKDVASKASLGGITYDQLTQQYKGAEAISSAITTKVPENLKQVAIQLSQGILKAVQKGVDAYADVKDQKAPAGLDTGSAAAGAGAGAAGGAAAGGMDMPKTTGAGARVTNAMAAATASAAAPAAASTTAAAAGSHLKPVGALAAVALAALAL